MTLTLAFWILDKEIEMIRRGTSNWPAVQDKPEPYAALAAVAIMQTVAVSLTPYHTIWQYHGAADWVIKDMAYTARTGRVRGAHMWYPKTSAFAARGGARFIAVKAGQRLLGPIGVGLLMWDAWHAGIWIGEKLFGEMD